MQRMAWLASGWPCAVLMLPLFAVTCGSESVNQASSTPGVVRLATEHLEQARLLAPDSLTIPLDDRWDCLSGTNLGFEGGAMVLPAGERKHVLQVDVEVEAQRYSEFRVSMKLGGGERALLSWESDLEPVAAANPGVEIPIAADAAYHTYVFPLRTGRAETWAGHITRLVFTPTDAPAQVAIRAVELAWAPPDAPARVTIDNCTHEALLGTQGPWQVSVPHGAVFQVNLGMLERSWRACGTDGVRFKATLDGPTCQDFVLVDKTLTPCEVPEHRGWVSAQADLSEFAGQEARITLAVDNRSTVAGDYACWGNPMILSRVEADTAIPVILISCDALRADHVHCYGYARETTPHLDAFAQESVVFDNAIAEVTWTLPSHMCMLTGLYRKNHRVTAQSNLAEETVTLAEVLARGGYVAAGFTGHSWWLLPWRGFAHGFDSYDTPASFRNAEATTLLVEDWLRRRGTDRFFLFFHNYDIHSKIDGKGYTHIYDTGDPRSRIFSETIPCAPSYERQGMDTPTFTEFLKAHNQGKLTVTEKEREHLVACYDDCIRYVDAAIHGFFQALKELGVYDRALIIVTSDHGEEFAEHGLYVHCQVYEECCHIPLIVKFPHGRFAGRRVSGLVQLADLRPTILDIVGLSDDGQADGQSVVTLLESKSAPRAVAYTQNGLCQAVRTRDTKLVRNLEREGLHELYDLEEDPAESVNRVGDAPAGLAGLKEQLEGFFDMTADAWHLTFINDGTPWRGEVRLTTTDRFLTVGVMRAYRLQREGLRISDHEVEAQIELGPSRKGEELVVGTASPGQQIALSVTSDSAFAVHGLAEETETTRAFVTVLDPADTRYPRSPCPVPPRTPVPTLSLWCGERRSSGTPAKQLPEEGLQELKALGYF